MPTEPKKGYTPIVLVSMEKEKEGREYLLPSKSHILLVWCVNVLTVFVVMFRWPWGWMLVSKWFFCIPQNSNKNNSNFLNLRFQTKKNLRFIYFFKFKNMWRFKLSILPAGFMNFQQFKFHISQYLIDSITVTPSISLSKRISKYSNFISQLNLQMEWEHLCLYFEKPNMCSIFKLISWS